MVEVELQGETSAGAATGWYALGRWAYDDTMFERTSVPGQADGHGSVAVDTFCAAPGLVAYRLRVTLSAAGFEAVPSVRMLGAIASSAAPVASETSTPGEAAGVDLDVPPYAQSVHDGEYPRYGGGGAAWCSPTSTAMVLDYWGSGPAAADLVWVDPEIADPCVDHAARFTHDAAYGTGNWSFNIAYAAHFGLDAFVTRLRSLQEAESFLAAGIPLVASIVAGPGELDGFQLPQGTDGHLVVIVGFTPGGDPIVNDPAARSNDAVRRSYDRTQFESVWLNGSGGAVYVITPRGMRLPPSPGNW